MTALQLSAVVSAATFIASVGVSAFIAGLHWGTANARLIQLDNRLAKIEGMFTLTLRSNDPHS